MSAAKRTTAGKRLSRKQADDTTSDAVEARSVGNGEDLEDRIRQRAYDIYCARNECDGNELEDWLVAERELRSSHTPEEGHARLLLDNVDGGHRREVMR
jgi:hypothetical protein